MAFAHVGLPISGPNPGTHHLTNLLLHAATAVLLFMVLARMTGGFGRGGGGPFRRPPPARGIGGVGFGARGRLERIVFRADSGGLCRVCPRPVFSAALPVLITAFGLGLMAKPMLVTLPLVLLLLDYWPLGRFPFRRRLVIEKVPLLLLSAISSMLTLSAQRNPGIESPDCHFVASRQCLGFLRRVPRSVLLAGGAGGVLSLSGRPAAELETSRGTGAVGVHLGGSAGRPAAAPLRAGRLAVVRGDAGAGDRAAASRRSRAGRPLYVLAADRLVPCPDLGSGRTVPVLVRSSLARWRGIGAGADGTDGWRVASGVVLEQ